MTIHLAILLLTFLVWLGNDEAPSPLKLHGFGDFLKKALKGVGKVAKKAAIPVALGLATGGIGSLAGLGVKGALGKIGGTALRGLGNFVTGGDGFQLSDLGRIAQAGLPIMGGVAAYKASKQAGKDSARSRELAEESMAISGEEYERAKQAWQSNQGMRDQYRQLSMNLGDATNPFTKAMTLAGGQPQYVGDAGMMPGQAPAAMAVVPQGGGISSVAQLLASHGGVPKTRGGAPGSREKPRKPGEDE